MKLSKILPLFIFNCIMMMSCINKQKTENIDIANSLCEYMLNEVSVYLFAEHHFISNDLTDESVKINMKRLSDIKEMSQSIDFEIISYTKAEQENKCLKAVFTNQKAAIYLIFLGNDINPTLYILTQNSKIVSVTPIYQGNRIIGWI